MTLDFHTLLIRENVPGLEIHSVEQAGGQFNHVLIVNNAWVFRFPRYSHGVTRLVAETDLLAVLQDRLPLAVPKVEIRHLDPPVPGLAFTGYPLLPGQVLDPTGLAACPADLQEQVSTQLAGFLNSLHAFAPADLPPVLPGSLDGSQPDTRLGWEALYTSVRKYLFSDMRPDARRLVADHFEAYLDDSRLHFFYPCLRHGDFGGDNILWNPSTGQVTGVIDFSFTALGDPAIDLASISTLGNDFFQNLAARYQPDPDKRAILLARARFYRGTYALMEALDGLRDNDPDAYRHGMEEYT